MQLLVINLHANSNLEPRNKWKTRAKILYELLRTKLEPLDFGNPLFITEILNTINIVCGNVPQSLNVRNVLYGDVFFSFQIMQTELPI